ncbi:MAG TPA: hypothetical protein VFA07_07565 [Chthonomonadaceae bacterium]|nr:hypothetical protein [Chthonomonadaceae bacterium]
MQGIRSERIGLVTATRSGVQVRLSWRQILFLASAALLLGAWGLQVNSYPSVADDSGRYLVLGQSLARTGDLRLLNAPHQPLDTLYPPGYPALIAFWIRLIGSDLDRVVLMVKTMQAGLLIALLPMLYALFERARLSKGSRAVALLICALCPALLCSANSVMSEIPFLFLCLASVLPVERDTRTAEEADRPQAWKRWLSLGCAVAAFLIRTAGVALLLALVGTFWRRFGWRWGALAALLTVACLGGWQARNHHIVAHSPPGVSHATYLHQFFIRDPANPAAGHIPPNLAGLCERIRTGLPTYIGMIPRAVLLVMSPPDTFWGVWFYLLAIPLTLLILLGFVLALRSGMALSGVFTALFWLQAALWPWHSARFLLPLVPFFLLYLFLGVEWVSARLKRAWGVPRTRLIEVAAGLLLLGYFLQVHGRLIRLTRLQGRTREEAGFYAACAWLKANAPDGSLVMGRPAYLLSLYSGHPTTQIEPKTDPFLLESRFMQPQHVRYLVEDAWWWAHSERYLRPYLRAFAGRWKPVWKDPAGSRVRIWQRN